MLATIFSSGKSGGAAKSKAGDRTRAPAAVTVYADARPFDPNFVTF